MKVKQTYIGWIDLIKDKTPLLAMRVYYVVYKPESKVHKSGTDSV